MQGPTQNKERPKAQTKYEMGLRPKMKQGWKHKKNHMRHQKCKKNTQDNKNRQQKITEVQGLQENIKTPKTRIDTATYREAKNRGKP